MRRDDFPKLMPCMFLDFYRKPSLLAQPGPLINLEEYVMTLQCCSETVYESFILHTDGASGAPGLGGQLRAGGSHASLSTGSVATALLGTYRGFGSLSHAPDVWSAPRGPLDIVITGESVHTPPILCGVQMACPRSREPQQVTGMNVRFL